MDESRREDFRAFVAGRSVALLRTAYLMTGNRADAEDLLQTALAKTYLAWDRINDRDHPEHYVRRVMANARTSRWRRSRGHEEYAVESVPETAGRDDFADLDLHDALWRAMRALPTKQRAVLVLRYYEQLSEAEIAEVLGCSAGTVKSQASRALVKLRANAGLADDPRATLPAATPEGATS